MKQLGKYEMLERLGAGSMGVIYRGRDTVLDREVAIKTIVATAIADPELKERFYREARACAKLQHPNIVTVYDFGEQDGVAYIAMELLAGTDLKKIVSEKHEVKLSQKLDIIAQVCEGLHHAHTHGIVHRDVKPSNVFVTKDGRPKVLDFGVARLPSSSLTLMGRVLGTPHYMAPEQIMGKPCDARSDIFSVGIVAFEFLCHLHPFYGDSTPKRIMQDPPHSLLGANPALPQDLEVALFKALEKDPAHRYPSAAELAAVVRAIKANITANPVSAPADLPPVSAEPARVPDSAPTEVIMSELLVSLQKFDEAVDRGDVITARKAYAEMKNVGEGDGRFAVAIQESSRRLIDLEARNPQLVAPVSEPEPLRPASPPLPPQPPQPPPAATTPRYDPPAPQPPSQPPPAAPPPHAPSVGGDATFLFSGSGSSAPQPSPPPVVVAPPPPIPAPQQATSPPPPVVPPLQDPFASARIHPIPDVKPAAPPPLPPPAKPVVAPAPPVSAVKPPTQQAARPAPSGPSTLVFVGIGLGAAALVVAAFLIFMRPKSAELVPAVATAQVTANEATLLAGPSSAEKVLTKVPKGQSINIIRAPEYPGQQWVEVQLVAGGLASRPGFMQTAELGNWMSSRAPVALGLLRAFAPSPGAGEGEVRQHLARLEDFLRRFPGAPEAADANLEAARANVALARIAVNSGQPLQPQSIQPMIDAATKALDSAALKPDLANPVQEVRRDLEGLQATVAATATPVVTPRVKPPIPIPLPGPAAEAPEVLVKRADDLWRAGDYEQAQRILERALRARPGFAAAEALLVKVRRSRELEGR